MIARIRTALLHAAVGAGVGGVSYGLGRALHLHQAYWAVIAALVVIQDDWTQTRVAAWNRFFGTAVGGILGWLAAASPLPMWLAFLLAVALGIGICYVSSVGGAGRLCAVTIAVIVLIPRQLPAHVTAFLRFSEVSLGIAVAVSWMWVQHRWFGDLAQPAAAK